MNIGGIGSVQTNMQLAVLRQVLDMASAQAKQMLTNMEQISGEGPGQLLDKKV